MCIRHRFLLFYVRQYDGVVNKVHSHPLAQTALRSVCARAWLCGEWTSRVCSPQVGYTSAPGQGGILAQREFDRRFSPHYVSVALSASSSRSALTCGDVISTSAALPVQQWTYHSHSSLSNVVMKQGWSYCIPAWCGTFLNFLWRGG